MSHIPVCAKCRIELRCVKNDFIVEEMADTTAPYRVWSTDLWACAGCGAEVVTGFAPQPMAEQWQANYGFKAANAALRFWPQADMVPAAGGCPGVLARGDAEPWPYMVPKPAAPLRVGPPKICVTCGAHPQLASCCSACRSEHTAECKSAADAQFAKEQR